MPINDALADEARQQIIQFLDETVTFLDELIREHLAVEPQYAQMSPLGEDVFPLLHPAWKEFLGDWREDWEGAIAQIGSTSAIDLQRAGLYGAQLNVKLALIERMEGKLRAGYRCLRDANFKSHFLILITALNNLLASIVQATGVGEALKEMKDVLATVFASPGK